MTPEWQKTFRDIAIAVSSKSKDGSSKVGAVLVRPDMTVASLGFNGFPRRMTDNMDYMTDPKFRSQKLGRMVHAEQNCVRFSRDNNTSDYKLVVTRHPCDVCALEICCTDISEVWYLRDAIFEERWSDKIALAKEYFNECGIQIFELVID